jgi:UDPglucose 6-dehydrogenase
VGYDLRIVKAAVGVNRERTSLALRKVERLLGDLQGRTVALLGLAFKPNTDDIRESPAIRIAQELREKGATVRGYDPVAMDRVRATEPEIVLCDDPYETARDADAVLLCTEWNEFRDLNMERLKELLRQAVLVDCRNIYDRERMEALGFRYDCFGR